MRVCEVGVCISVGVSVIARDIRSNYRPNVSVSYCFCLALKETAHNYEIKTRTQNMKALEYLI